MITFVKLPRSGALRHTKTNVFTTGIIKTKENITIAHKKLINFVTTGCY